MRLKSLFVAVLILALPGLQSVHADAGPRPAPHARVDRALADEIARAGSNGAVAAFAIFRDGVPHTAALKTISKLGLKVGTDLAAANAAYVVGPARAFMKLASSKSVLRLQADRKLPLLRSTGTWATRVRELNQPTGGLDLRVRDANGHVIDGTGVGIAIVDSGVDAIHSDLTWCHLPGAHSDSCKTVVNYKVKCSTSFVGIGLQNPNTNHCFSKVVMSDVADSDSSSGHGTHVAGIAAGTGAASLGKSPGGSPYIQGVAPGAKLYGFGSGETDFIDVLQAAASFDWIIKNGSSYSPAIKVINNSYGGPGFDDPTDVLTRLSNAAIAKGITVVWAAGNSGAGPCTPTTDPTATVPCTSSSANNRTPGNLSIANYDDAGTGTRDNALESDSSQGIAGQPETYPTVAAPGSSISSTCAPYIPFCDAYGVFALPEPAYAPNYSVLSGTSMASPHVTGIVSLLYQANPSITPAEVQTILENTAHKFSSGAPYETDPVNPDNTTSADKGHGLVDAHAAVLAAMGLAADTGLDGAASPTTIVADGDGGDAQNASTDLIRVAISDDAAGNLVNVKWTVHNVGAKPSSGSVIRYQLNASVDGTKRALSVDWDGQNVVCTQDLASHCTGSLDATTATFTASYDAVAFGAVKGSPVFDVWASVFGALTEGAPCRGGDGLGLVDIPAPCITDRAPGVDQKNAAGVFATTAPERGTPHIFTFTPTGGQGSCPVGAPLILDPAGDATQFFVDDGGVLPTEPTLDITRGDLSWDPTGRAVTFHVTVPALSAAPPTGGEGKLFRFDFSYAGVSFELQGQTNDVTASETYTLNTVLPGGVQYSKVTNLTGAFDVGNHEVRIVLPVDTFNSAVSAFFAAQSPPIPAPPAMGEGSTLGDFVISAQRVEGALTATADVASGTCPYVIG